MDALSLISDPERNPKRNFAFSVYSVKAADMPTLSSLISSSRIPVTACSLSSMSSTSTFARLAPVEQICERSGISGKQLFKWLALWKSHKQIWLGILADSETTDKAFWQSLQEKENYSFFSSDFTRLTSHSFLQSHANPVLSSPPGARYCQKVFAPDISIF